LACLLYCVSLVSGELVPNLVGVADQPVVAHEFQNFRVYWSEVAAPEALLEGPSRQTAEQKFRSVLREIVARTTPIPFPFPAVVPDLEAVEKLIAEQREYFDDALIRLADTVQYEMIATWAADEQTDFSAPVMGSEYLKRRMEVETRIAAIDTKLKSVAVGCVHEWRSRQDRRKHHWFALVSRADRDRFIAALRNAGPSEGVLLRLSGPWPPSEFVTRISDQRSCVGQERRQS
jgi:gas vesicle protein GvpL/GvpF